MCNINMKCNSKTATTNTPPESGDGGRTAATNDINNSYGIVHRPNHRQPRPRLPATPPSNSSNAGGNKAEAAATAAAHIGSDSDYDDDDDGDRNDGSAAVPVTRSEEDDWLLFRPLLAHKMWSHLFCGGDGGTRPNRRTVAAGAANNNSTVNTKQASQQQRGGGGKWRRRWTFAPSPSPPPPQSGQRNCDEDLRTVYVIVVCVTFACYLNGMYGDFVHDDIPAITMNKDVLALNPLATTFRNDFWGTAMSDPSSHKSYRPLSTLSFRLNYLLFGLRSEWFHLTNIVLHAIVCILFTRICFCVAGLEKQFCLIAGTIFAVHPIHTEAVTGVVGRADLLACLFFLLSLLLYHGSPSSSSVSLSATSPTKRNIWLSIVYGGLSMLAKETGITVFMVNLAYDGYRKWPHLLQCFTDVRWQLNQEARAFLKRAAHILAFSVIFLALRIAIGGSLPKFSQQDNPAAYHPDLSTRFLTFSYLAAFNWWLVLCPITLSHDWQMSSIPLITSWCDGRNLLTILIVVLVVLLTIKSVWDFKNHQHFALILGLLMLTIPFLPASNIIVTVGFVVAERVLYIPSLGSILLIVYGMQLVWNYIRIPLGQLLLPPLILVLVVCSSLKTVHRNDDWTSRESLLRSGLRVLPHNAKMHYNFGNFLRDTQQIPLAIHHYEMALDLWPTYSSAHNNLGTLVQDVRRAEFHFLEAIRFSKGHLNAHFNLGQLYKRTNRTGKANQMLQTCIRMDPKFIPGYIELFKMSRGKSAEALLRQMAEIATTDQSIMYMFGKWLLMHGYSEKAYSVFTRAFRLDFFNRLGFLSYLNASQMLRNMGQKARLLQYILRWHLIRQERLGRKGYQSNIYLREWVIKMELQNRAKIYDNQEEMVRGLTTGATSRSSPTTDQSTVNNNNKRPQVYKNMRLKLQFSHKNCNITKWLYPIVKKDHRWPIPLRSQYVLEQILLQQSQAHEKHSPKTQQCINSILRHLRLSRKVAPLHQHKDHVMPFLMANFLDQL